MSLIIFLYLHKKYFFFIFDYYKFVLLWEMGEGDAENKGKGSSTDTDSWEGGWGKGGSSFVLLMQGGVTFGQKTIKAFYLLNLYMALFQSHDFFTKNYVTPSPSFALITPGPPIRITGKLSPVENPQNLSRKCWRWLICFL